MCLQNTHEQNTILSSNSHDACEDVTATVTTREHQKVPRTVVRGRISICTQFVWKCVRDADAQTLPFTGAEGEEEKMTGDLRTCSS